MTTGRPGRRHLKIGELERALGVTRDQVHHYVELGLVLPPEKSSATLAWYGPEHQAAIARVRAIRDAGGSLAQAQRWLVGSLQHPGPEDCATLTRWVLGDRGAGSTAVSRPRARVPVDAVVAMIDAGLAGIAPDALVAGATADPSAWLDELAARWREREEHARLIIAREALEASTGARLAGWLPIAASRVDGGVMRASVLAGAVPSDDRDVLEERARLGVILPTKPGAPSPPLDGGGWSLVARATDSMRARRWNDARITLSAVNPGAVGSTLARALGWCNDALAAARGGDGVLAMVSRLGELRAIEADAVADLIERLRLRWTLAVTWLALPLRWDGGRPLVELTALLAELAAVPSGDRQRATGELDVLEANAGLALASARLRVGDRAGSAAAARAVGAFGGAAGLEAARRVRRASRAM